MTNKTKRLISILTGIFSLLAVAAIFVTEAKASCAMVIKASDLEALSKTPLLTPKPASAAPIAKPVRDEDSDGGYPSIVGMWHVYYSGPFPGGTQEAFQIFNAGGTEVHNPKADPRSGSLCLGTWIQKGRNVKLTHRVWLWDPFGNYVGLGDLEVKITLGDRGNIQTGTLTMEIFFPDGSSTGPIPGTLTGERVSTN